MLKKIEKFVIVKIKDVPKDILRNADIQKNAGFDLKVMFTARDKELPEAVSNNVNLAQVVNYKSYEDMVKASIV